MTPNSTTINFDPAIPTDWEKSTYYVRDAQGNVMAIYEYTIDDVTQDNHYTLTERNIYGSSRLGNNNAPVEMIATTPPNPSQYSHHIGYRQYELSNHLGNVLAVLSDRKIARDTDQDNTVDYYEPDVLLTYDYSPFGAPLHARSFTKEVCDEVTSTQKIEDLNTNFDDGTTQGWQPLSGTTQRDASSGRLRVFKQGGGAGQLGVQQSITATSGYVYDFTINIENAINPSSTVVLEILDPNNTVIYTQSVSNGNTNTFSTQFTASATGTYVVKIYRTGNNGNGSFYIDDALITHEEEVTQTLCEDFAGYRYGFNGQEKDDEIKGAGNSYDFGERIQDPRLGGRFLSIDRLYGKFPFYSPYQFAGNSPLSFIDLDGLEPESMISKNGKLTKPVISLLNAAFDYDEKFLLQTTWKGVDKVNMMNSQAMTVYDEVRYKNSLNDNEVLYDDEFWLDLIAHEQKHRDDIGNGSIAATIWYASYGLNYIVGGFSYENNEDEKRAFEYGLSEGSLMDRLLSKRGKEIISILDSKLTPDEKASKLKIIGLEFKLSLLEEKLQMTEAIFGNSIEEIKAKIIDPIKRQISVVSGAINSAKINAVKSNETNNTTENSTNSDVSVVKQNEKIISQKDVSNNNPQGTTSKPTKSSTGENSKIVESPDN